MEVVYRGVPQVRVAPRCGEVPPGVGGGDLPLYVLSEVGDKVRFRWRPRARGSGVRSGSLGVVRVGHPHPSLVWAVITVLDNVHCLGVPGRLPSAFISSLVTVDANVGLDLVEDCPLSFVRSRLQGIEDIGEEFMMLTVPHGPRGVQDPLDEVKGATAVSVDVQSLGIFTSVCLLWRA